MIGRYIVVKSSKALLYLEEKKGKKDKERVLAISFFQKNSSSIQKMLPKASCRSWMSN